ncbi:MAG: hypothetical protein RSP_07720 [Rhodanobacter sp.]
MTLPLNRQPTTELPPQDPLPCAGKPPVEPASSHGDYDHRPLRVGGLEHYVQPEEDARFHVS